MGVFGTVPRTRYAFCKAFGRNINPRLPRKTVTIFCKLSHNASFGAYPMRLLHQAVAVVSFHMREAQIYGECRLRYRAEKENLQTSVLVQVRGGELQIVKRTAVI